MKELNINKQRITALSVVTIFNIIFQLIPLASIFGYEFSVLNAILFFFLSGILVISKKPLGKILVTLAAAMVIAPLISIIHTVLTIKCSLSDGLSFYVVNSIPGMFFGFASGFFSLRFLPKYPKLLLFLIFFSTVIIAVGEIYFNPQVYIYNLFTGYFPGTIYDEAIIVSGKLLLYRLFNLIFFILLTYGLLSVRRFPEKILILYFIIIPALFVLLSPYIGFASSKNGIEKQLGGKCITPHFEIIYDKSINNSLLKNIILHHECFYNELKKFYRLEPEKKITSFVFRDEEQKGALFGAENADVAKPWLEQIYTTKENYNSTLKHEISHIFTASFGTGLFKVAKGLNPALIEGAAVASDPFFSSFYVDQLAAAAYKNNYNVDLQGIFSGFSFFGNVSTLGYVYAGSFSNYMIQKYGIDRFTKWYSGESFDSVYNLKMSTASEDYLYYLQGVKSSANSNTAKLFFARQTIFSKACPRYTASQIKKGREAFNIGNYKEAENLFREVLGITTSYSALSGLCNTLIREKKEKEALEILKKEAPNYSKGAYFFNLELLQADVSVLNDSIREGQRLYSELYQQDPDIQYSLISDLRLRLLKASLLKEYLEEKDSTKFAILKELNKNELVFSSVPELISLSESLEIKKDELMKILDKPWDTKDYISSYSAYLISNYLMEQLDYSWARKYAALAYRFNQGKFSLLLRSHYLKSEWIYINSKEILDNVIFKND